MNKQTLKRKLAAIAAGASAAAVGVSANAAPIEFDTAEFLANIGAAEGFAVTAGLLIIGLTATISVLRKSRGAVR